MKEFFKYMFASMLGFFITLVIAFFFLIGIVAFVMSYADKKATVTENSVLLMKLDREVFDRTQKDPFSNMGPAFDMKLALGLDDLLDNLKKAAMDDRIEGVLLDLSSVPSSYTVIDEIRKALLEFKTSGKWVMSYADVYSQGSYYLSTASDRLFMNPTGIVEFKGLGLELMFLKGTLEKLDIEVQVIRHGKYKSALEPLMYDRMSADNREQLEAYINSTWAYMVDEVALSRGLTAEALNSAADELETFDADNALALGFVDALYYRDELYMELRDSLDLEGDDKISMISIEKYNNVPEPGKKKRASDKIAIVYAIGAIESGEGDDQTIGSERIARAIRKARKDDKVKAVVMRVNSPGGSAIASEVIRREVELTSKEKPVIVSMGRYAASGGYWISCPADKIVADPTTLTGSIGVFGMIPNMEKFFDNKLGITFDYAQTNKHSDFITASRPLDPHQRLVIRQQIEKIYAEFLAIVAEGRGMTEEQVDEIAQGRIWSAVHALEIGLVDELGGLERALELAAEMAELEEYRIDKLPEMKDPFKQLLDDLKGGASTFMVRQELGDYYTYYEYIKSLEKMEGVQARLPFEMKVY